MPESDSRNTLPVTGSYAESDTAAVSRAEKRYSFSAAADSNIPSEGADAKSYRDENRTRPPPETAAKQPETETTPVPKRAATLPSDMSITARVVYSIPSETHIHSPSPVSISFSPPEYTAPPEKVYSGV